MDRLIPVVNKLQDVFQRCGFLVPVDLPQVVVVGTQSSGKSSVLESIIGREILPRGTGVVTRRPLLIQLIKLSPRGGRSHSGLEYSSDKKKKKEKAEPENAQENVDFWVEFLHLPGQKFCDISAIREEIRAETDRAAGTNKRLVPNALIIKIFATDVVNLTLIDLPGITKVPVGDQPPDIERLVRAMINSYIENKHTIILAVHPANTDLATSDALQMARAVDPQGLRTLGVITKLDLMDSGTNALDMLNGRIIPLRRGFVGVVNRSQEQLNKDQSIAEARLAEMKFFKSNPVYAPYADRMGSSYLAAKLSSMLMEHIRDTLPDIRIKLTAQLSHVQEQLRSLGPVLSGSEDQAASLLNLLTRYAADFSNALDGRSSAATHELSGGARISYIFYDKFGRDLDAMDPFQELGTEDIRTALRNATGHRTPLFIPESAFELLVKRQLARFLAPSLSCVELVYDELTRLAESVETPELTRFVRLRDSVAEETLKLLKQQKEPTIEMVRNLIKMELSYINTWNPSFIGGKRALTAVVQESQIKQQAQASQNRQPQAAAGKPSAMNPLTSLAAAAHIIPRAAVTGRESVDSSSKEHHDAWMEKNLLGHSGLNPGALRNGFVENESDKTLNGSEKTRGDVGANVVDRLGGSDLSRTVDRLNGNGWTTGRAFASVPAHIRVGGSAPVSQEERQELDIMRLLVESYFDIVRKRLQDMVPKAVITFLVGKCKECLQATLVTKLYKPENVALLMKEGEEASQRRKDLDAVCTMLTRALDVINEVRDIY